MTRKAQWEKIVQRLRDEHPAEFPVVIIFDRLRRKRSVCDGETWLSKTQKRFYISIREAQAFSARVDTLLHEWAHAMSWFACKRKDHGVAWARAYAALYNDMEHMRWGKKL